MLKGNCWKKNLTTCERKISLYKPAFTEAAIERCSVKKMFLEISQDSQGNLCKSLFFNEVANFTKKETLIQVFSCEFCENSKNIFLHRIPLVAASVHKNKNISMQKSDNDNPVVIFNKIDYLDKMENLLNDLQK